MLFLIITRNGSFQERDDQKVFAWDCCTVGLMGNKAFAPAAFCLLWRVPTSVTAIISCEVNQIQSSVCLNGVSFRLFRQAGGCTLDPSIRTFVLQATL